MLTTVTVIILVVRTHRRTHTLRLFFEKKTSFHTEKPATIILSVASLLHNLISITNLLQQYNSKGLGAMIVGKGLLSFLSDR